MSPLDRPTDSGSFWRSREDRSRSRSRRRAARSDDSSFVIGEVSASSSRAAIGRPAFGASCETDVINGRETCVHVGACTRSQRGRRDSLCPTAAASGAQAASNRGCLHENAVTRDRSAVSLLHLAEQAPAEVVGALSQLVQLDNAERGRPHARKLGEHQSRARLLRFGRRRSDQRLSRTLGVRRSRRNTRGEAEVPRPRRPGAARTPKYHREPFGRGRPPVAARTRHNPSTQSCGMGTAISVRFPNTARNSRSQAPAARWQAGMTSRKPRRYSWSARTDSPLQGLR